MYLVLDSLVRDVLVLDILYCDSLARDSLARNSLARDSHARAFLARALMIPSLPLQDILRRCFLNSINTLNRPETRRGAVHRLIRDSCERREGARDSRDRVPPGVKCLFDAYN